MLKICIIIIHNEVMDSSKASRNLGLYIHVILSWAVQDIPAVLQYTKNTLDDITSLSVTQIEKFFLVDWTRKSIFNQKSGIIIKISHTVWQHGPTLQGDTVPPDMEQEECRNLQILHLQGRTFRRE